MCTTSFVARYSSVTLRALIVNADSDALSANCNSRELQLERKRLKSMKTRAKQNTPAVWTTGVFMKTKKDVLNGAAAPSSRPGFFQRIPSG